MSGLHFGSYSLAAAPVADAFAALARGERDRFISLDPNVRPTVEPDMDVWRARLAVLFPLADLVKISAEDLELLQPGQGAPRRFAADLTARASRLVVVTDGGEAAHGLDRRRASCDGAPPKVEVVDTVGAGDTFQAALIARLLARPGGPQAALAALDAGRLAATPRLRRPRRGDHLLAARRRPAAGRRTDRLKDDTRWSQPSSPSSRSTW